MVTPPTSAWNMINEPAHASAQPPRSPRGQELDLWFAPTADRRFERRALLGQGGMGAVHRVRDLRLGREAALKVIRDPLADPVTCERFLREARIMGGLNHPSIPPLFEAGRAPSGELYMLMRLVEGRTLSQRIAEHHAAGRPEDEQRELLEALVRAGEAVAYAHSQGVLHRDLKPSNIMIGDFGEVMVLDWGLAKLRSDPATTGSDRGFAEDPSLTSEGSVIGTPGYMPPEQARGEEADERADVFALGACLCEVLSGAPPVQGADALGRIMQTIKGRVRRPSELRRGVHRELDALAAAAMAPDRERRLASAEAFVLDLRRFLAGRELESSPDSIPRRVARLLRRRSGATALLAAVCLSVALFGQLWSWAERAQDRLETFKRAELAARDEADEKEGQSRETLARLRAGERAHRARILFENARANARNGLEPAQTRRTIEAALEDGGESPAALLEAAEIYALGRCDEESRAMAARALNLSGNNAADLIRAAEASRYMVDLRRAADLLAEAARAPAQAPEALFRLHLLQGRGRELSRTPALEQLLSLPDSGRSEPLVLARVIDDAASGRFAEARARLDGLEGGGALALWFDLARALVLARMGPDGPALQAFEAAMAGHSPSAEAYRLRGDHHFRLNRWGQAYSDYKRALKLNPRCVESLIGLGAARHKLHKPLARSELATALELEPDKPRALAWLSEIDRREGKAAEALTRITRVLELDPSCVRGLLVAARLAADARDLQSANANCSLAIKNGAPLRESLALRANILIDLGEYKAALVDCDRLVRLDESDVRPRQLRGRVLARQGRDAEALEDFDAVYAARPKDARLLKARGRVLYRLKHLRRAKADYDAAIVIDPELAELYYYRGLLHVETDNRDLAANDLRRFLSRSPRNPRAQKARELLARLEDVGRKP